jgi:radical SAM superfamily enzyme YgiQ (UPF0313 family)
MHVKLISPKMSLRPMDSEYKRVLSPSISLLTVAALTPREHCVTLEDENTGPLRFDDRPDLVGITVNVDTSHRAYAIAARYRALGVPVVLGGIHVSANPEEARRHANAVCVGEAEGSWPAILRDAEAGALKTQYSNNTPTDGARIPCPAWDCLDKAAYLYTNIVCASRSCPHTCEFCYNSCDYVHHIHRPRPVAKVLREIERLGTRHVMFIDDNFIGNIAWTREFVAGLAGFGIKWNAAVSTNLLQHPDLMDAMRASGCQSLFIGFESVNGDSTQAVGKRQNHRETYDTLIRELHIREIMVNASLVFGFDNDRTDVFERTVAWLVGNKVETMTAHILTPYPGTRLYRRFKAEHRIVDFDWSHYNTAHVVYEPKHMTRQELFTGYLWAYRKFYSLTNIVRRIPDSPRQRIPYLLFNLGYRKFGKITSFVARHGLMHRVGRLARRLSYGIQ